jgi:hypothetical protein
LYLGGGAVRRGPRSTELRADDLRYEGTASEGKPPKKPIILASAMRGRKLTFRLTIDQSPPPADWPSMDKAHSTGGGEVGVLFGLNRLVGYGGIKDGVPAITIGHAVIVGDGRVRLVQILRDGEYNIELRRLGEASLPGSRTGKRPMEVMVDPGTVTVSLDGKRVSLPWKPEGDSADGFAGFVFNGVGHAVIDKPTITVR